MTEGLAAQHTHHGRLSKL